MSKKMRDRKWKKQVFAAFMAASMAAASVAGGNPYGLTIHAGTEAEKLETEQGMFYVTDGVLTYYEGDATELTIPEDVTEIGSCAFSGAKKLKKIVVGENVKKLQQFALCAGGNLEEVEFAEGITEISESCFFYQAKLSKVNIPDSVTKIGEGAFWGTDLSELPEMKNVTEIEEYAFYDNKKITEINIPKNIVAVGYNAFGGTTAEKLVVPGGLKSVDADEILGYKNAENLKTVVFEEGVEEIRSSSFYGFEKLESVKFPESLVRIDSFAFYGCDSLKKVSIPSAKEINYGFAQCENLKEVELGEKVERLETAFFGCEKLTDVTMKAGLKVIGQNAFASTAIKELAIPSTVVSIDDYSMPDTLEKVELPSSSLCYVGATAFENTKWYKELKKEAEEKNEDFIIVNNVLLNTTYDYQNASRNQSDEEIEVEETEAPVATEQVEETEQPVATEQAEETENPEETVEPEESVNPVSSPAVKATSTPKVTSTPKATMDASENEDTEETATPKVEATAETEVEIEETEVDADGTETAKTSYTNITLPEGVNVVANFKTYTKELVIPEGVVAVGSVYGYDLEKLKVPETVTQIGEDFCGGNTKLNSVVLPSKLETIPKYAFVNCSSIEGITIPEGVKSIGTSAFKGATKLNKVNIPDSVTEIGLWAFSNTALQELTIPASVTSINEDAFENCSENMKFKGYTGSYFEGFAKEHNLDFTSIGTVENVQATTAPTEVPEIPMEGEDNSSYEIIDEEKIGEARQIKLDCNGGESDYNLFTAYDNTKIDDLPVPVKEGYVFVGWSVAPEGGAILVNEDALYLAGDQTLFAQWKPMLHTVKFDSKTAGKTLKDMVVLEGEGFGELPEVESSKEKGVFEGWFTQPEGGEQITEDTVVHGGEEITLYAHWSKADKSIDPKDLELSVDDENGVTIGKEVYEEVYGNTPMAEELAEQEGKKDNVSFGEAGADLFFIEEEDDVEVSQFDKNAQTPSDLEETDTAVKDFVNTIEVMEDSEAVRTDYVENENKFQTIYDEVEKVEKGIGHPVLITMTHEGERKTVLGYSVKEDEEDNKGTVAVADPENVNEIKQIVFSKSEEEKEYTSWSYEVSDENTWNDKNADITFTTYETLLGIWNSIGQETEADMNFVDISGDGLENMEIRDEDGRLLATVEDGQLETNSEDVIPVDDDVEDGLSFYVAEDEVKVNFEDKKDHNVDVEISSDERKAEVEAVTDEIVFDMDDLEEDMDIEIQPEENTEYKIVLESDEFEDEDKVELSGVGEADAKVSLEENEQGITVEDTEEATLNVDGEVTETVDVTAKSNEGGDISREGDLSVEKGEDAVYAITPEVGYMVDDVLVDGQSVGAVDVYTFDKISGTHTIEAVFTEADFTEATVTGIASAEDETVLEDMYVMVNDRILTEDDDYTIEVISENDNEVEVEITGENYFEGAKVTKKVSKKNLAQGGDDVQLPSDGAAGNHTQAPTETQAPVSTTTQAPIGSAGSETTPAPTQAPAGGASNLVGNTIPGAQNNNNATQNNNTAAAATNTADGAASEVSTFTKGGLQYKVLSNDSVAVMKAVKSVKKVVIPAKVTQNGKTYKVTKINAKAFAGQKNLKKIVIKSTTLKSVGAKAFKGIASKAVINVPKSVKNTYKKMLKGKGQTDSVKIK